MDMFVETRRCRSGINGGLRLAREASGYAEMDGLSEISVSDDEASKSTSVLDDASGVCCDVKRLVFAFARVLLTGGGGRALLRFGGGGKAEAVTVDFFVGFSMSSFVRGEGLWAV